MSTARSIQLQNKEDGLPVVRTCSLGGASREDDQFDPHYAVGRLGTQKKGVRLRLVGIQRDWSLHSPSYTHTLTKGNSVRPGEKGSGSLLYFMGGLHS